MASVNLSPSLKASRELLKATRKLADFTIVKVIKRLLNQKTLFFQIWCLSISLVDQMF